MWAACRPDSTPERTKRFRFGGPKTELVYRVNERGCAAVQAREVTGIHGSCLEYKLNQGSKVAERNPHQRSKANSALTSVAPFDCTHGVAAPRADLKQQCEVSLCIEWILRAPARRCPTWRCNFRCAAIGCRSAGVVQRRAASKIY